MMKWGDSAAWSEVDGIRWLRGLIGQLVESHCAGVSGLRVSGSRRRCSAVQRCRRMVGVGRCWMRPPRRPLSGAAPPWLPSH
jgi:hypothetical protein